MRYTHNFKLIRSRKHTFQISLILTIILLILIIVLGFTKFDAIQFFVGFILSLTRIIIAYTLALVIALALVLLITPKKSIEDISLPILDTLQSFPSFALYPLLLVWFGKTSFVTICILTLEMIWPILFSCISAKKQIPSEILDAGKVFGAKGIKYYSYIFFPMIFPSLVTGSIVAWGEAWETIIAAEIIVNIPGIGSYLASVGNSNNSQVLVVGVVLLLGILFVLNKLIWLPLLNLSTKYQQQ